MSDTPDWTAPAIRINPTGNMTATLTAGQTVVMLDDTTGFRVGDSCAITGQTGSGQETFTGLAIDAVAANSVTLSNSLSSTLNMPGDVVGFPTVIVQPPTGDSLIPVAVDQLNVTTAVPGAPVPLAWSEQQAFVAGTTPSLSETPASGNALVVTYVHATMFTGSTLVGLELQLKGSSVGVKWLGTLAGPAVAGSKDSDGFDTVGYEFALNEMVTLATTAAVPTGAFVTLSWGGYVVA